MKCVNNNFKKICLNDLKDNLNRQIKDYETKLVELKQVITLSYQNLFLPIRNTHQMN